MVVSAGSDAEEVTRAVSVAWSTDHVSTQPLGTCSQWSWCETGGRLAAAARVEKRAGAPDPSRARDDPGCRIATQLPRSSSPMGTSSGMAAVWGAGPNSATVERRACTDIAVLEVNDHL